MSTPLDQIKPTTLRGIKQLAKKISATNGCMHTIALDEAARQAGFENYVHARRQLPPEVKK